MTSNSIPSGTRGGTPPWLTLALYGAVLFLLALPIFSVTVPPLNDYANHLARIHVLADYARSPALQANYLVSWKPTPYLAMDVIVPPLAHLMPLYLAGKVFLFLCLFLFVAGTAAIHGALFGKLSPWPAASALFCYNYVFSLGFANYLIGVGVWLLAFAAWIVLSRGPELRRFLVGTVLALLVYFSHYFAFLGYLLCIAFYELGIWLSEPRREFSGLLRRGVISGAPFIPVMVFVALAPAANGGVTVFGTLRDKLPVLLGAVQFPGARFDLVILAFALLVFGYGLVSGRLRLHPAMRFPILALAVISLVTPNIIVGLWGQDFRFSFVIAFLLIAGSTWTALPPRAAQALTAAMLLLVAANCASIVKSWRPIAEHFDEFREAVRVIPPGARVVAFRDHEGIDPTLLHGSVGTYYHMPLLAVVERDAYVPFLFKMTMMTVGSAPRNKAIDTPHGHPIEVEYFLAGADPVNGPRTLGEVDRQGRHNYWGGWPNNYDYAVELSFGAHPQLPPQLELVAKGKIFNIYRIRKPA